MRTDVEHRFLLLWVSTKSDWICMFRTLKQCHMSGLHLTNGSIFYTWLSAGAVQNHHYMKIKKIRSWKASWSWQEEHKYIEVITHPPLGQLVRSNWFPHPSSGVSHSWMTSSWGLHVPTLLSVERWDCSATEHTRTASVDGSQHAWHIWTEKARNIQACLYSSVMQSGGQGSSFSVLS